MQQIILTDRQKRELERLKELPLPYIYAGECAGCGLPVPVQYLAYVTKWRSVNRGSHLQKMRVHIAMQIWCRECKGRGYVPKAEKLEHNYYANAPETNGQPRKLRAREIAGLLMAKMSHNKPRTSRKLAEIANLEWEPKFVKILTILYRKKIVRFQEGKWTLR